MSHTIIIGNGIAGITTARHVRKSDRNARITVISGESPHFFSRTALMYVYMGHMKWEHIKPYEDAFWKKNRIDLKQYWVDSIDFGARVVYLREGQPLIYDNLVIATGSKPAFFNWPGQELSGVQGLYSRQDLEMLEAHTPVQGERGHHCRQAVVVGGGLIGVELAEMLLSRNVEVTMLIREKHYWGNVLTANESAIIEDHMQEHGVRLLKETTLSAIQGDESGRVEAVETSSHGRIPCQLVGITTGVKPNIDFLRESALEINKGIRVNEFLETNIPSVFAAGDCAELRSPLPGRRAIEPVWYTGRMMGECLGATLGGRRTPYLPGPWFNSAKFFDIEYQTYGIVSPRPSDIESHFFWKQPRHNKFATIAWEPVSGKFTGINAFGVRLRHEYFDKALRNGSSVQDVITGLKAAFFDPEFYEDWTPLVAKAFFAEANFDNQGVHEA